MTYDWHNLDGYGHVQQAHRLQHPALHVFVNALGVYGHLYHDRPLMGWSASIVRPCECEAKRHKWDHTHNLGTYPTAAAARAACEAADA